MPFFCFMAALRSAEFAFTHKKWGGQSWDYVCVYVCVYVRVFAFTVFVCAGKGEQWEGKKVYLTCWQSCFSKIHQCEKKKREEKQQKTDTESSLLKPRSPLFYFFKQSLAGLDKLLRASDGVRKPSGVAMTKIKKNICSYLELRKASFTQPLGDTQRWCVFYHMAELCGDE